ncbi:ATP-dependent DNA helicase RecG [Aeromicrobium terrae]|uniref:ATP-dependent DNA helicase RecG n=1 Tax=Aeromicrobium terrae TaxID=2498846 RepID=A0A5C8NLX1_9ACTN|nr:ATP-dependent DNA helicase RecG [Aeromicrobium terrae]TXL62709.1 ATP-dependent DNA helicase RecG [Aeromicrobium terrae]
MVDLSTRLRSVVGDKTAKALETAFGMVTVDDLLRHYPRRYVGVGELSDLSTLRPGQYATILARVVSAKNYSFGPGGKRTRTEVIVTDGTGRLTLTFFQQAWRLKTLAEGTVGLFAGEVGEFRGTPQLTHPIFEPVSDEDGPSEDSRLARGIIPIYPASAKVTSFSLERSVAQALAVVDLGEDPLPAEVRAARGLADQAEAFEHIHRPRAKEQWQRARDRFRFEEAFVLQSVFAQRRHVVEHDRATAREQVPDGLRERFAERLPFTLTRGQREVADVIAADLARTHPMHRLLQGEVGSGKTVVALLAMLQVVDAGGQAALLAPTEVLAAQHHRAISTLLGDLAQGGMLGGADRATRVQLLTGSLGAKARREALDDAASGEAGIVVGTHALIQEGVEFADLGLLVVDEQHRFGVEQRSALVDRSEVKPHVLVMTATPIPRTVAMTVFGDLETSTLRELPAGRQPVQTTVVPAAERPEWLARAWERVREEVAKGRQAYVVVSRIGTGGGDEDKDTTSLVDLHDELVGGPLSGLRLAMLHGQLPADEKDAVMRSFAAGEIDVLVATTVVEVGVDVPNATVMVVMDADRFGLSQLHQLRGRVGRGSEPGLCLLVTNSEVETSRERLAAVAATSDGFELSQLDVELRHEGDVLGSRQSGVRSSLRLLSVVRHEDVIVDARDAAQAVVESDPTLAEHPALAAAIRALEETEQADYLERT